MSYTPRIDSTTPELVVCRESIKCDIDECAHKKPHRRRDASCELPCAGCDDGDDAICVPAEFPVDPELARLGDNALRYHRMWVRLGEEIKRLRGGHDNFYLALVSRYMDYLEEAEK